MLLHQSKIESRPQTNTAYRLPLIDTFNNSDDVNQTLDVSLPEREYCLDPEEPLLSLQIKNKYLVIEDTFNIIPPHIGGTDLQKDLKQKPPRKILHCGTIAEPQTSNVFPLMNCQRKYQFWSSTRPAMKPF